MPANRKTHVVGRAAVVLVLLAALIGNMRLLERQFVKEPPNIMVGDERVPPTLALTTFALGPLRGLIVDGLWWRLIQQQDRGDFFETIQLTDWITSLQPRFPQVWAYNAWNLCYNVAFEFPEPMMRWKWIERSIRLLQDEGLKYNPGNPVIRKQLAWIFLDRIGKHGDPAQAVFRRLWAEKVMVYLHRGNRAELEAMQKALEKGDALYAEAGVADLLKAANRAGLDLRKPAVVVALKEDDPRLKPILDSPQRLAAWKELALYSRAWGVEHRLGYSVSRMLFLDREYGPFDWRLSQAYAVYWAVGGRQTFAQFLSRKNDQLDIMTRQAMVQSFHSGRLIYNPHTGFFMVTNNLRIVGKVHDYYDKLLELNPSKNTRDLHEEFLSEAVAVLYSYQYVDAARELYKHYVADYVGKSPPPPFDTFVVENMYRVLHGRVYNDDESIIHAALFQAYFWLAVNDMRRAVGYVRMARLVYERHQRQYAGSPAFLLPSFAVLKRGALTEIRRSHLAGFLAKRLAGSPDLGTGKNATAKPALYLGAFAEKKGTGGEKTAPQGAASGE